MTGLGLGVRVALVVALMSAALWTVNVVRSAGRLEAELEVSRSQYADLVSRAQRVAQATDNREKQVRTVVKRFVEYRERASEVVDVECDPRALDEQYVEQLRLATAAAVQLPDGSAGVAQSNGGSSTAALDGGRVEDLQPVHAGSASALQ